MTTKLETKQFFDGDKTFENEVRLTQEETKRLDDFQYDYLLSNGFGSISGGFAQIILEELDEDYSQVILGYMKSGIQNDCENAVYQDKLMFNRVTKVITFI